MSLVPPHIPVHVCVVSWFPPDSIVLPDFSPSSSPLLSKPFVSVRCFLLRHVPPHLQLPFCSERMLLLKSGRRLQIDPFTLFFDQPLRSIGLARRLSLSPWTDRFHLRRGSPCTPFPPSISSYPFPLIFFPTSLLLPFLTPFPPPPPPPPLLFFFLSV